MFATLPHVPFSRLLVALVLLAVLAACDESPDRVKSPKFHPPAAGVPPQRTDGEIVRDSRAPASSREAALWRMIREKRADVSTFWKEVAAGFDDYSPEVLAAFVECVPISTAAYVPFTKACVPYIESLTDIRRFSAFIAALNVDDLRLIFLSGAASRLPLFSPATLHDFEELCRTDHERQEFAKGMDQRLYRLPKDQLMPVAQAYLDGDPSSKVASAIIGAVILYREPQDARGSADWLLSLPADVAATGDQSLLAMDALNDPGAGKDFLRRLESLQQPARAAAAAAQFATAYLDSHPEDASRWILELPDALGAVKTQALIEAYDGLWKRDPAQAKEYTKSITDRTALTAIEERRAVSEAEERKGKGGAETLR